MINELEKWVVQTNNTYAKHRKSCSIFREQFRGYYSPVFLSSVYFVVVEKIPRPDMAGLSDAGLDDFLNINVAGITYGDTYYVHRQTAHHLRLHFHELVHVLQWKELGPLGFIKRYIYEIQNYGYHEAPLEKMAYRLEYQYQENTKDLNVEAFVRANL